MSITTSTYYNPSVNIIRDIDRDLKYIPTPNTELIIRQFARQYRNGSHSFNIVGAYGTGKSTFLWALEKELNKKRRIFECKLEISDFAFEIIPLTGEYTSIIQTFATFLGIKDKNKITTAEILAEISRLYNNSKKNSRGVAIFIDEFGKFLEYAAKNNPEAELYFIQQLAELINDPEKDIILITTLHQGFNSYSRELEKHQQEEWNKVKGRLIELTFNEPVEQLLLLATEKLDNIDNPLPGNFTFLFKCIKESKSFPLRDYFSNEVAKKLLPFDILAASLLTLALQRYGQNQRSLFSFIDSNSHLSINNYNSKNNPYYNIACVYDYLLFNFYSHLSTKYNPDFSHWASLKNSLERVDAIFINNLSDAQKIIKTIGLLTIFASKGAIVNKDFLINYSKESLGVSNPAGIIKDLETHKIILYSLYNKKYRLFEGTDLNIELAINEAGNLVQKVDDIVDYLQKYFDFPYILAKEAFYENGTPRFFGFSLSASPQTKIPEGETDGYINLIFNENLSENDLKVYSLKCNEAILFGAYKNTGAINKIIFEIEKIKKVIETNKDDRFALQELNSILDHQKNLLNHFILDSLYSPDHILWFYSGGSIEIKNHKDLNKILSKISKEVYFGTPILKSELINRTKLSSAISIARKNLLNRLVNSFNKNDFGFEPDKFPPEKSIYLSLIKGPGFHNHNNNSFLLSAPTDKSFKALWNIGLEFIESTKSGKREINDLVDIFIYKPFKLKQGFIDFWLPIFLFINREKYALYENNRFIPILSPETLELITKKPVNYKIKAFDIDGAKLELFNKYRYFLNQVEENQPTIESFIETIKPFIIFYRSLQPYSVNTIRISKKAIEFRKAIANAEDPEKAFFEDYPKALGFSVYELINQDSNIEEFIIQIKGCIQEINSAYDNLINRIEDFILNKIIGKQLDFPEYKNLLITRFSQIKNHLLTTEQKAVLQRIKSPLDDRKSWINSLAFVVIGRSLEQFSDEDEDIFYEKLKHKVRELDNLCELSTADIDEQSEDVFKIEVTSFVKGLEKRLIRLPKQNLQDIVRIEEELKLLLKEYNKDLNIALLVKILQDQLKNEE